MKKYKSLYMMLIIVFIVNTLFFNHVKAIEVEESNIEREVIIEETTIITDESVISEDVLEEPISEKEVISEDVLKELISEEEVTSENIEKENIVEETIVNENTDDVIEEEVITEEKTNDTTEEIIVNEEIIVEEELKEEINLMDKEPRLKNYFNKIEWIERGGILSISLEPKLDGLLFTTKDEVLSKEIDKAFALVENVYAEDYRWNNQSQSIYDQYICHVYFAGKDKTPWNLEPQRPVVSGFAILLSKCNPAINTSVPAANKDTFVLNRNTLLYQHLLVEEVIVPEVIIPEIVIPSPTPTPSPSPTPTVAEMKNPEVTIPVVKEETKIIEENKNLLEKEEGKLIINKLNKLTIYFIKNK